ncbi:MAG: hypothetical protein HQK53_14555, partial [Oligoflexia bacterium]|nr:hypothetical protein [Oligoflexia bacterium]
MKLKIIIVFLLFLVCNGAVYYFTSTRYEGIDVENVKLKAKNIELEHKLDELKSKFVQIYNADIGLKANPQKNLQKLERINEFNKNTFTSLPSPVSSDLKKIAGQGQEIGLTEKPTIQHHKQTAGVNEEEAYSANFALGDWGNYEKEIKNINDQKSVKKILDKVKIPSIIDEFKNMKDVESNHSKIVKQLSGSFIGSLKFSDPNKADGVVHLNLDSENNDDTHLKFMVQIESQYSNGTWSGDGSTG